MMPTQDKHSACIRSTAQINLLADKLTNTRQLPSTSPHQFTTPLTYIFANSHPHKLISLKLTNSSTYKLANSQPYQLVNPKTYKFINLPTHNLTNLINLSTQKLTNSSTYKLTASPIPQLKNLNCCFLFYNATLIFTPF